MNTLSDNAIMLRVKAGDLDKMGLLFERYHRRLYGFLFHMTYEREASEDMVQHVFYKMLRSCHTFTGQGEFVAWMFQIARNALKDEVKKNKYKKGSGYSLEDLADSLGADGCTPEEALEKKQAKLALYNAMAKLSEDHREVLTLSRLQELKYQEIAQILDISEGTVKVRAHRALQELKNIYTKMQH